MKKLNVLFLCFMIVFPSAFVFAKDFGKEYCLIMGVKNPDKSLVVKVGDDYYHFCCPTCISMFKSNPSEYMKQYKFFDINTDLYKDDILVSRDDYVTLNFSPALKIEKVTIEKYKNFVLKKDLGTVEFLATKKGQFKVEAITSTKKINFNLVVK